MTYIDQREELDAGAIGKHIHPHKPEFGGNGHDAGFVELEELIRRIGVAENFHPSMRSLIGKVMARGITDDLITATCRVFFDQAKADNPRLADRDFKEITDIIQWCRGKEDAKGAKPGAPPHPPPPTDVFNFAELEGMTFDPLKWIVPHYIPEGVTLLAGKPKVGKSWLMLGIALSVARGEAILDELCVERDVLYFALEDSKRRLQDRTRKILGSTPGWPKNIIGFLEMPTIDNGGIAFLEERIKEYPNTGVIIIDTLAKFRGKKHKDEDQYQADYRTMSALLDLGHRTGVSIIVVHHVRKQGSDDLFDTISGTLGLNGGADTLAILTRTNMDGQLRLANRGRDTESLDKTLNFDGECGSFIVVGDYEEPVAGSSSGDVNLILKTLKDSKITMTPDQVAKATGLDRHYVQTTMNRLNRQGKISRTTYGSYEARP